MAYLTDIEIAQQCQMQPIMQIAQKAHVDEKYVEQGLFVTRKNTFQDLFPLRKGLLSFSILWYLMDRELFCHKTL